MADLPDGLDGRKQLVTAALARLKVVWQAEAVRKVNGRAGQSVNGSSRILPPQNPPPGGPSRCRRTTRTSRRSPYPAGAGARRPR